MPPESEHYENLHMSPSVPTRPEPSLHDRTESRQRTPVVQTRDAMRGYVHLYHGTSLASGRAILREGIRIPTASRWVAGGKPISMEYGFRF